MRLRTIIQTLLCGTIMSFSLPSWGQEVGESIEVIVHENGQEIKEEIGLPLSMTYPLDSLLADWKVKNFIAPATDCNMENVNPVVSDSVIMDRLSRMPTVIEMPFNEVVRKFIDLYTGNLRERVSYMVSASNFYMPIFEEALEAYGLPMELKYLPIIESALDPNAVSRAGAAGLWQFMVGTGKIYGLETNSLIDERRDPIKSTWAAVRYLKDLYDIYHDWPLVIAAYNSGPGNINKAISRAGGKRDYWAIYNYLRTETQGYVPSFIAANYVMTYYCKHNICPKETSLPVASDTIQVNERIHLQQIAEVCGVELDALKSLNPQYRQNIIPGDTKAQTLRLPQKYITAFIEKQDTILAYKTAQFFKNRRTAAVPTTSRATASRTTSRASSASSGNTPTYHKIKSGETLSTIAARYGTTVAKLRSLNGIRGSKINAGKNIRVK